MWECSGREHDQTEDAEGGPEESWGEASSPQSSIQGQEMGGPEDQDHEIHAVLDRAPCPDVREPHDCPLRLGRIRTHEHADDDEYHQKEDASEHPGQATPAQDACSRSACPKAFMTDVH